MSGVSALQTACLPGEGGNDGAKAKKGTACLLKAGTEGCCAAASTCCLSSTTGACCRRSLIVTACSTSPMPARVCQAAGSKPPSRFLRWGRYGLLRCDQRCCYRITAGLSSAIACARPDTFTAAHSDTDDAHLALDLSSRAARSASTDRPPRRSPRPWQPMAMSRQRGSGRLVHSDGAVQAAQASLPAAGVPAARQSRSRRRSRPAAAELEAARWRFQDGVAIVDIGIALLNNNRSVTMLSSHFALCVGAHNRLSSNRIVAHVHA